METPIKKKLDLRAEMCLSPYDLCEKLTGTRPESFPEGMTADDVHKYLAQHGAESEDCPLWDYPITEVEHVIENGIPVVLVLLSHYEGIDCVQELRWFEVPADYKEENE